MLNKAAISADIVSSTALNVDERLFLDKKLLELLAIFERKFGSKKIYSRLIKGDYIECFFEKPKHSLRAALLLKSFVKSLNIAKNDNSKKVKLFKNYGVRIAVGIGGLEIFDKENGVIGGQAITLSGRAINEISKTKQTLIFRSERQKWNDNFFVIFNFLDELFNRNTKAQSEVIFHLLLGKKEKEIAQILNKTQSAVNQHANIANWRAVDSAVKYFEKTVK